MNDFYSDYYFLSTLKALTVLPAIETTRACFSESEAKRINKQRLRSLLV